ncbi:hypothetical protein C7S16_1742 [Burkholderia thailandensis]|uniref:Uncharacterized protein n=1 Tax=Burkholderia thailandensis TaxID=57975 RepID=A0AAW9CZP2_BURTH|nr:hypothetical protein [Burkholderia thailandensis]MDW9256405.1 hypothetical protein [Burkholderia thailandensis]
MGYPVPPPHGSNPGQRRARTCASSMSDNISACGACAARPVRRARLFMPCASFLRPGATPCGGL